MVLFLTRFLVVLLGVLLAEGVARADHEPGRVLVRFHPAAGALTRTFLLRAAGAEDLGAVPGTDVRALQLPFGQPEDAIVAALRRCPAVDFAEPDTRYTPDELTPNDTHFGSQWALRKIAGPSAWPATTGSAGITIAVLDSGIDGAHPDLARYAGARLELL